ncbi:hypothetical protein SAMN04489761_2848 [Tenacibaculum sp. MAR_2009_124]|uniref:hypothetical protein n=1 Tax=Tenacibaculum sp. MAR_2009_124 TaxID=1250059 RepID=UPI00089AD153|nr:hypothetical protein [Tenacibaculum sp. MAR_2009_124]SEC38597.1 hypothetical protein SAMN04489761_2848 [Tenacibaculum sp. MAR_2009_124]
MLNELKIKGSLLVYGIPLLMMLMVAMVVKSSLFSPLLSYFITIDLLITIPFIHYLLIRKREISKKSIVAVIAIGFLTAYYILPEENREALSMTQSILMPLLELGIIGYVITKIRASIQKVKLDSENFDFFDKTQEVCNDILPFKFGAFLATEISVIYYGLLNWRKRKLNKLEYSYHKNSTAVSLILGFLLVVLVEMFVTHSMMKHGNAKGSIILAVLSGYSLLQIIAVLRSLSSRPIFIDLKKQELILKFGILSKAVIPFSVIKNVELNSKELPEKTDVKYFALLGRSLGHNLILNFKKDIKYNSFYGFSKKASKLAIWVDEHVDFQKQLEMVIRND